LNYRRNQIKEFTGIDAPYEAPESPDLVIDTSCNSIEVSIDELEDYVLRIFL
jgi:adenylylsulfate kinase-like enzyme